MDGGACVNADDLKAKVVCAGIKNPKGRKANSPGRRTADPAFQLPATAWLNREYLTSTKGKLRPSVKNGFSRFSSVTIVNLDPAFALPIKRTDFGENRCSWRVRLLRKIDLPAFVL